MSELVRKLSTGDHPVIVSLRPAATAAAFKDAIDRGYVLVKFTETRGGTELGVKLEPQATTAGAADFDAARGTVRLAGTLTLDYIDVRCVAEIDLETLAGRGHLEVVAQPEAATV